VCKAQLSSNAHFSENEMELPLFQSKQFSQSRFPLAWITGCVRQDKIL